MIHLGDITKISGYDAPTVDVIVGGSPCQDLSIAGKRAGLDGERSGLFMEQIRIIKEMREKDVQCGRTDVDIRPRYMVWENVPGAFSSNKGEDFRVVLEETAKVVDKDASIPMPNNGKWTTSGCILGNGWSIAWRVLDAQFWGVPQRRRRIALVADFGGHSAPEILFVRKSLSGDTEQSQPKRKATSSDAAGCTGADDSIGYDGYNGELTGNKASTLGVNCGMSTGRNGVIKKAYTLKVRGGCEGGGKGALVQTEKSATLSTLQDQTLFQPMCYSVDQGGGKSACNVQEGQAPTLTCTHGGEPAICYSIENHPADSRVDIDDSGKVQTLTSRMGTGGGNVPMVMEKAVYRKSKRAQTSDDATTWVEADVSNTLNTFDQGEARANELVVALDRASYNQGQNAQFDIGVDEKGIAQSLVAKGLGAVCYGIGAYHSNAWKSDNPHSGVYEADTAKTLDALNCGYPACNQGGMAVVDAKYIDTTHADDVVRTDDIVAPLQARDYKGGKLISTCYTVRRLTPLECERLQGYPDGWTDIGEYVDTNGKKKQSSDAARYKALGNSIAIPPWKWVMKRLCACYERDATLASLFDGIGGFPLIWEQLNGKGTCLWASEIEEFPIAVTKKRIGG